jgi:hypothetical protein
MTLLLLPLLLASLGLPLLVYSVRNSTGRDKEKRGKWTHAHRVRSCPSSSSPFVVQAFACLTIIILILAATPVGAVDIQALPEETSARHGYTYAAKITFEDLNNADNACTILRLGPIPTNAYVDRVAWAITTPFTNSTASATNLLLCVGVGGATNTFFTTNQIDCSPTMVLSGLTVWALNTNMVTPYKATTSTNTLQATISAAASTVDTYTRGELRIYWRIVEPGRIRF